MKIALAIPFNRGKLADEDYLRKYITQPEVTKIFQAGTGYPGETASDVAAVMPNMMEAFKAAEREGFDAVVTCPHTHAGVEDGRELVKIPIVSPLEVGAHISLMLGHKVCVITPSLALKRWNDARIQNFGLEKMVFVKRINSTVEEMLPQYEEYLKSGKRGKAIEQTVSAGIEAIEEDDAQALMIGCGGMMWLVELANEDLKKRGYDIPFVNPMPTAVEIAKVLVTLKLTHSRYTYPGFDWEKAYKDRE
jgi:allantoin racemase